jgi:beta-mannosidase
MKTVHDLSSLSWKLTGFTPHAWRFAQTMEIGIEPIPEVPPINAKVPGSVQRALRRARLLPDWNVDLRSRDCEWVENRHWIFETALRDDWFSDSDAFCRLHCDGLDGNGEILLNGQSIGRFDNAFIPYSFDLSPFLQASENRLQIVFECPSRWLGQVGFTSQITDWKPRFNYTWDWTPRLVQIGVWDKIRLEVGDGFELATIRVQTDFDWATQRGWLRVCADARGAFTERHKVRIVLEDSADGRVLSAQAYTPQQIFAGIEWNDLKVQLWQPNGQERRNFYTARVQLIENGRVLQEESRRVGFKSIEWKACKNAPPEADPWLCVINGAPIFLQGVNWTPILPNFADCSEDDYRQRLEQYQELGCNLVRVWGGAFLEKDIFYDLCDELGILVWQEFPLSSSGLDNWPPEDERAIEELCHIASAYIQRRAHHACLLMWCGGNELQGSLDGGKTGVGKPVDNSHPLMARLQKLVANEDSTHRFVPTSSSGPRFMADAADFGKGLHWDVHGPWNVSGDWDEWKQYWKNDDSLFRSETGCPGASGADLIQKYADELAVVPGTLDNPLWRRSSWWIDWPEFVKEFGREPEDIQEYCAWSQERQKTALVIAARECKKRFPACGGFLLWMGHDSFPCASNTSIIDFLGRPKAAALGLGQVFQTTPENLRSENE